MSYMERCSWQLYLSHCPLLMVGLLLLAVEGGVDEEGGVGRVSCSRQLFQSNRPFYKGGFVSPGCGV